MSYGEEMPERLRQRLERVGDMTEEERQSLAAQAEIEALLRPYFTNEIDNEAVFTSLQGYVKTGRWNLIKLARERLNASFKRDEHSIRFIDNADGTITVEKEERVTPPSSEQQGTNGQVIEVTDETLEATVAGPGVVVVDCWAVWCGPCRMVAPVIEELAKDYAGKVTFAKLDVDKNPATARKFGIQSIPTILFFKDGKMVEQKIGAMPKAMLEPIVKKHAE
ncbi:MAG: thioredoxin [Chloroflexota bacterium]